MISIQEISSINTRSKTFRLTLVNFAIHVKVWSQIADVNSEEVFTEVLKADPELSILSLGHSQGFLDLCGHQVPFFTPTTR